MCFEVKWKRDTSSKNLGGINLLKWELWIILKNKFRLTSKINQISFSAQKQEMYWFFKE